jgi:hypothetical protein
MRTPPTVEPAGSADARSVASLIRMGWDTRVEGGRFRCGGRLDKWWSIPLLTRASTDNSWLEFGGPSLRWRSKLAPTPARCVPFDPKRDGVKPDVARKKQATP